MPRNVPKNYTLESLKKKYPGRRITTLQLMTAEGVELENWEAEMIAELPPERQAQAWKLSDEARRERDAKNDAEKKLEQKLDAYLRTSRCIN